MKYLKIKNLGKIEPQALTLMGASTKVGDNTKIGMFGSGNKYALSYFIRNNIDVKIFSGEEEIKISTKREIFRDEEFDIIYINDEKTSLTTKMGKDWILWQAIREIYCNAIDEGGTSIEIVEEISPYELETHIYIEGTFEVLEFMENLDKYFTLNRTPLATTEQGDIYAKVSQEVNLFRKGIKCSNDDDSSVFDYDFKEANINESRVLSYNWEGSERFWKIFTLLEDINIIDNIFQGMQNKGNFESITNSSATLYMMNVSEVFMSHLKTLYLAPLELGGLCSDEEKASYTFIPSKVYETLEKYLDPDKIATQFRSKTKGSFFKEHEMTPMEEATMKRAMEFFKECKYEINYEIKVVSFSSKHILGSTGDNTIYVSNLAIEKGVHDLCNTIIEEQIHLKYDVSDESREFQTAAINEMLTIMKKAYAFAM